MNLFTARLTGKMLSTDAYEQAVKDLQERVKRYRQIEKSPELAEYLELKKLVESSDFQERRNELVNRKYKDTEEGRKVNAHDKLASLLRIKMYNYAKGSDTFQAALKFRESEAFQNAADPFRFLQELHESAELAGVGSVDRIGERDQHRGLPET